MRTMAVQPIGRKVQYGSIREAASNIDCLTMADEQLVIDMSGVDKIDVADLGAITQLLKRQRELGGDLRLVNLAGQPLQMLNELGCARLLTTPPADHSGKTSVTNAFRSFVASVKLDRADPH